MNIFRSFLVFASIVLSLESAQANLTGYRPPHPIGLMHLLPIGEKPGWSTMRWFQVDYQVGNVWNASYDIINNKNGKVLTYEADYEEYTTILHLGQAVSDTWAWQVEVPHVARSGGALDTFIDSFHVMIGSDRFSREIYDHDQNVFKIQVDGVDQLRTSQANGIGNIKLKAKWWPWQIRGFIPGSCDCGFALSFQAKIPTQSYAEGLTSGKVDGSVVAHFGLPVGSQSAWWFTAGYSYLQDNPFLKDFNFYNFQQMYETSFDFAVTDEWGLTLQMRMESPILDKKNLAPLTSSGTTQDLIDRIASGWNSLVLWRGTQAMGIRYRPNAQWVSQFLFIEDWGWGGYDQRGDNLYVNNAPDVVFLWQNVIGF